MVKYEYTNSGLFELINAIPIAIVVIGEDTKIRLVNIAMQEFTGKSDTEMVGLYGGQVFNCEYLEENLKGCGHAPPCKVCHLRNSILKAMTSGNNVTKLEIPFMIKGGSSKIFKISTKQFNIDNKINVLVTLEDVTQEKKNERDILENGRLNAAISTAGKITHEMSQPLMILNGNINLLISDIKADANDLKITASDEHYERIDKILATLKRLNDVTHRLQHSTANQFNEYLSNGITEI